MSSHIVDIASAGAAVAIVSPDGIIRKYITVSNDNFFHFLFLEIVIDLSYFLLFRTILPSMLKSSLRRLIF